MSSEPKKEVRVWLDACFDMAHFGHANAIRQSKALGDKLIFGIHNDEDVTRAKGPPVFKEEERYRMARAMRWVDEVVEGAPYVTTLETLDKHNCDFCVHGDDLSIGPDGVDTFKTVKDAKRYREIPRTKGVSTTDLVGRLLLATRSKNDEVEDVGEESPYTGTAVSGICTSAMVAQFYGSRRKPGPNDKVVYVAGAFDLFHIGHLAFLEAAAKEGTYLIVGIHKNKTVTQYKGAYRPLLSLHERCLTVLAYRCVDDVIMGAPYAISKEILDMFNVSVVCHGSRTPVLPRDVAPDEDPYEEPKRRGIFKLVDSGSDVNTDTLFDRIVKNRETYKERNRKKQAKELRTISTVLQNQEQPQKSI